MKKVLKWIGIILLLLLIVAISLPFLFKDKIIARVKEEANKNLNAKVDFGEYDLSLIKSFPDVQLDLNDLSIVGINEFEGDTLISLKSLKLNINLMSAIKGVQYELNEIILNDPRIYAKVTRDGKANWDITKPSEETAPATESQPFKMTLKNFEINNGRVIYDDDQSDIESIIIDLDHNLKGDFTEDYFTLKTNTTIGSLDVSSGGIKYLKEVNTRLKADLDADMPNFKFTFKENELQLNELALFFDGVIAMPGNDISMDMKFKAKQTEFKNILSLVPGVYTKDFKDVKTEGRLALDGFVKGIYNEKMMPGFGINLLIDKAMFKYPSLPRSVNNIYVDLKVNNKDGNPDNTIVNLKKLHLEMGPNPVDVKMNVSTPVSDANIDGEIKGKLDLSSVKDFVPLETDQKLSGTIISDITLKGRMSSIEKQQYEKFNAKGQFIIMDMDYSAKDISYRVKINRAFMNFTPSFLEISAFDALLGKSDIKAAGKIENFLAYAFKDETIKGKFTLNSNLMDLNELMGPETEETTAADTISTGVAEVPSNIDFVLNSYIGMLLYDNMEMKNVSGNLVVRDSKVSMSDLKMNLLDGSMVVNGSYDTKNIKKPHVDFDLAIADFDITKTFKTFNTIEKLAPVAKYANGKFNTTFKFSSDLDQKMEAILTTLGGYGKLQTKNVVVSNFAPITKVADAIKMEKYKSFALNNTNISFAFKDGKVNIDPFDVKIGNSSITMFGSNGFDQTINYTMAFDIPKNELGSAANTAVSGLLAKASGKGANVSLPENIKINALIGGTVTNPTVKVDLKESGKAVVEDLKEQAKAELDKKKAELEGKAKAEIDKAKADAEAKARGEAEKAKAEAEAKAKAEADKLKKEAEQKAKKEGEKVIKDLFGKPKK